MIPRGKDIQKLMDGMMEKNRLLTSKNDEYIQLTEKHADAKRDYGVSLAKRIIGLKFDKHPATLILQLAKGDSAVAELRYKRDVAKGVMDACRESIKDIRSAIDSYRSLLTWEREEKRLTPNQEA